MLYWAIFTAIAAYLVGSMPFGFWVAKLFKGADFDIRDWGSHNIGATNAIRVLKWGGIIVFFLDTAKGFIPTYLAYHTLHLGVAVSLIVFAASFFGHAKSLYFFITERYWGGGKSVATALGGVAALHNQSWH